MEPGFHNVYQYNLHYSYIRSYCLDSNIDRIDMGLDDIDLVGQFVFDSHNVVQYILEYRYKHSRCLDSNIDRIDKGLGDMGLVGQFVIHNVFQYILDCRYIGSYYLDYDIDHIDMGLVGMDLEEELVYGFHNADHYKNAGIDMRSLSLDVNSARYYTDLDYRRLYSHINDHYNLEDMSTQTFGPG